MKTLLLFGVLLSTLMSAAQVLDPSFGQDGRFFISYGSARPEGREILLDAEGRIVVNGQLVFDVNDNASNDFWMFRLLSDGSLDESFGQVDSGILIDEILENERDESRGVIEDENGGYISVVRLVDSETETDKFGLLYLNEDGTRNDNIGDDGLVDYLSIPGRFYLSSIQMLPDGSLVSTGHEDDFGLANMLLVNFLPDGTLNNTFGTNGIVEEDFFFSFDRSQNAVIQSDGKIVCVGWSFNFNTDNTELIITRFNADGTRDNTFADNGLFHLAATGPDNRFTDVTLDNAGHIIAAGNFGVENNQDIAVVRLLPDGTQDPAFNNGELLTLDHSGNEDRCNGLDLLSGGDIIIGATVENSNTGNADMALLRISPEGALDNTFGENGWFTVDILGDDELENIAVTSDNGVLMLGNSGGEGLTSWLEVLKVLPDGGTFIEQYERGNVQVYPVPSTGVFHVSATDLTKVIVSDARGQVLFETTDSRIDLNGYPKGIYLLGITISQGSVMKRVVLE